MLVSDSSHGSLYRCTEAKRSFKTRTFFQYRPVLLNPLVADKFSLAKSRSFWLCFDSKVGRDPRIDPKVLLNKEHHGFGTENEKPETDFK